MSRILVTGATGFIGQHLIPELLAKGHQVIATGTRDRQQVQTPWIDQVEYLAYDLNQPEPEPYHYFGQPDILIHLAWQGLPNYQALFHFEQNLPASYALIKALVSGGLKQVTVLGTCFEYGLQNGQLSETLITLPANAYALAKDTLRQFLERLASQHAFALKWVRLFYLYGEGQPANSILSQLKLALEKDLPVFNMSGGEQLRDYLPVETVAGHLAKIALHPEFTGIVNCCSGQPVSIRKLVENYLHSQNRSIQLNMGYYPYSEHEAMAFWGDTDKLSQVLATAP